MALIDAVTAFPVCDDRNPPLTAQKLQNAATLVISVFMQYAVKLLRVSLLPFSSLFRISLATSVLVRLAM